MLSLNSKDDPIIPADCVPKQELEENENCIHIETNGGGHVEFLSQLKPRMVILFLIS
jgi:predicted alpha/beta-fold hydrolase